jgi:branched-chain amino acid transport system substrate-binding protein
MKSRVRFRFCRHPSAALLLGFLVLWPTAGCSTPPEGVTTIGAVLPLSGEVASYGKDSKDGIDLAIELAQRVKGHARFMVQYEDSQGDPKGALAALQKLLSVNRVPAVIGENVSSATLAMIPLIDKAPVVLISPSASTPKLSGASRFFFRVFPSDVEEGRYSATTVAKLWPLAKVSVLYVTNDFGVGLMDVFKKEAPAQGLQVLDTLGYDKTVTDFRPILTKVKDERPDVIYMAGYYQDGGAILKQAKQLGIEAHFWGATTHEDPQLLTIAGDSAEGFHYPVSTGFDASSQDSVVSAFVSEFRNKYKKDPGLVSALGYDCGKLLADAVISGNLSAETIRAYLAGVKNYDGASGKMTFDAQGDVHKAIQLKEVKNGKFVFAAP